MTSKSDFDKLVSPIPVSRRRFLFGALGAGFALAVQPVEAQSVIHTDVIGLDASEIRIPTGDGEIPGYQAQPAGGGRHWPVVLVVQEIFGVHDYIQDVCRRLAKQGYLAIAPELYARQGDPRQYKDIQDVLAKVVSKVPDAQVLADLDACVVWAQTHGGDTARLGITGFCWGGRIVWLYAAHNPRLKAGVAWYGRLVGQPSELSPTNPIDLAGKLYAPVLGLYGGSDPGIPLATVEQMRMALADSGDRASRASKFHVYDDAGHAFHADYRPSYRKGAAEDGWHRMLAWFRKNGV